MPCMLLCDPASSAYYYSSNANANRALVRQYRSVSAGMNLRVMGIVETLLDPRALHDCTYMGLYSHVALSHCAPCTSLVDFHTQYDQPFGPSALRVFITERGRSLLEGPCAYEPL